MSRRRALLYGLTAGVALAEGVGLRAAGMLATMPLAAQASSVPARGTRWGDAGSGSYGCPAVDHPSAVRPRRWGA